MKKRAPRRDWRDAEAKLQAEPWCRYCGSTEGLEKAHTVARRCDRPHPNGGPGLWVNPDDIVVLCKTHHLAFDAHELDILGVLHPHEQARAVLMAGGIMSALRRLSGGRGRETR